MSCKRRANVIPEYVEDTSSDEDQNDPRDFDYDVSSSGRSIPGRQDNNSIASNASSETRRRGRGVSKRPCLNRNAQMARENRQRKKEYLEKVENKLSYYRQENKNLSNVIQRQGIDLKRLKAEVSYLKNVLNNSSSITTLLKSMNDTLSGKNSNKTNEKIVNFRNGKDSGNENSTDKDDEIRSKIWNDAGRTTWWRGGKFIDRSATRINPYELTAGNLKNQTLGDSDHTYTTSRDGSYDEKVKNYNENDIPCSKDSGNFSEIGSDRFINDLSVNQINFGVSDEIDGLPPFDDNIFETIGNEDANESMEYFRSDGFNDNPGNLFESLENSGICLHVNSGKISLEFCSICHLNSINSTE